MPRTEPGRNGNGHPLLPPRTAFGSALRSARLARGMSQRRLSEVAGLHRSHVNRYESGDRVPTLQAAFALLAALGLSDDEAAALLVAGIRGERDR